MAEFIERESLLAEYDRVHVGPPGGARKLIEEAPAADVVPVVHCRDCKHITPVEGGLPLCALHNIARAYNDFCSAGARMEDGE
jgi:hypothetical protein